MDFPVIPGLQILSWRNVSGAELGRSDRGAIGFCPNPENV